MGSGSDDGLTSLCWLLRRQCDAQARRAELAETQLEQVNKTLSRIQQDQQTLTMQMNILQRSLEEGLTL